MFEKVCMVMTLCLIVTFSGIYYYQRGIEAPQECIMLADDYQRLVKLLENDKYKRFAIKIITEAYVDHIKSIEKNYQSLMKKRFKRNKGKALKRACSQVKYQLNINEIIEILEQYQTKI